MEPIARNALQAKIRIKQLAQRCSIAVHSRRKRLADSDGISAKAVIDGLTAAGILKDDNPECVKEVSFSQEKVKSESEEETIIELWVEKVRAN